jgi:hypothetical protein
LNKFELTYSLINNEKILELFKKLFEKNAALAQFDEILDVK